MPSIDENDIKEQLKTELKSHLYFIYGDEGYLKKLYTDKIIKKFADGDLKKYDGEAFSLDNFCDDVELYPMTGGIKHILIRDLDISAMKAEDRKIIESAVSDIPEYCRLIFWLDTVTFDSKNSAWKSFLASVQKSGQTLELKTVQKNTAMKILRDGAKRRGCEMSSSIASDIISKCGLDMQTLRSELEKVCAYCGKGEITREHVNAVIVKSVDAKGYELAKAIIKNQFTRAFLILDDLFYMKTEPAMILGAVSGAFTDLYRAKCAVKSGFGTSIVTERFTSYKGREFKLKYAAQDASGISMDQLKSCIEHIYQADKALKSGRTDNRIILENLISKLFFESAAKTH